VGADVGGRAYRGGYVWVVEVVGWNRGTDWREYEGLGVYDRFRVIDCVMGAFEGLGCRAGSGQSCRAVGILAEGLCRGHVWGELRLVIVGGGTVWGLSAEWRALRVHFM